MSAITLSPELTQQVLGYLGCLEKSPSVRYLNQLIQGYIRQVPFESVTRIIKRHTTDKTAECPRWPEEFWNEAMSFGSGGSCFECNLAFFSLLTNVGFDGYLTINDMGESRACHTASVILLQGQKYLVDVAIPLHCALPIHNDRSTKRLTRFHTYTIKPSGKAIFEVERSHHPKQNIFTLVDTPIPIGRYKIAVERDYEVNGYFLDRVVIVKVIGNRVWRFNSMERPFKLEGFDKMSRKEIIIPPERIAGTLAEHFDIPEGKIATALSCMDLVRR